MRRTRSERGGPLIHQIKLQKPERARVRVDEVAKALGVRNNEVLRVLRDELNEFVQHARSYIEEPVFRRLCAHYGVELPIQEVRKDSGVVWRDESRRPLRDASSTPQSPASESTMNAVRFKRPPVLRKRNNNPMAPIPSPLGRDSTAPDRRSAISRDVAVPLRGNDAWPADVSETMAPFAWRLWRFSDIEKDCWLAAGLRENQAKIARDARANGLEPGDLGREVSGFTVLDRLTHGEGAKGVARLLRRAFGAA